MKNLKKETENEQKLDFYFSDAEEDSSENVEDIFEKEKDIKRVQNEQEA